MISFIKRKIIYLIILSYLIYFKNIFSQSSEVGIDEHLGQPLPLESEFFTSEGEKVKLKEIINSPVLLALIYYECPGLCNPMQSDVAWLIDKMDLIPGADYKIISLSFDWKEKPEIAARWKRNYLHSMKKKIDEKDWLFLTGDSLNITKLTKAVGFYFEKNKEGQFIHPSVLISISPEGKITRYILGPTFNPFDVKMALIEAKANKTSPTITKVLEFCYSYNPEGRKYALNITRIAGIIILMGTGIFFTTLLFRSRKKRTES